ncbi:6-phosphogluconolactonase [Candidatus Cyanaurora vandensis]|uniref:6-phosphogluconolactonase n=1 Tax=Candidatus Cyanaurora vandensis TaxID=2714958 RepID=UPI002580AE90|nr:6-phosphogluconolactonase [Candidatus Cyanaurora vandensis]
MSPEVHPDSTALAQRVARWLMDQLQANQGPFNIGLSGGSTPEILYRTLAQSPFRESFPWARVHWFWGDERFVPPTDPNSNYRMVNQALLSHCPVPADHIHPIPTEGMAPETAALAYEQELIAHYGAPTLEPARPFFDVHFFGLGPDGHTASLFPGKPVLQERDHWVQAVYEPGLKPFVTRVTMTYPLLNSTRAGAFLVAGAEKQAILHELLTGTSTTPAARIQPVGNLYWFVDQTAMG